MKRIELQRASVCHGRDVGVDVFDLRTIVLLFFISSYLLYCTTLEEQEVVVPFPLYGS